MRAVEILKHFLAMVEAQEMPLEEDPNLAQYRKDLDKTYREAVQDCITLLEQTLDNPSPERRGTMKVTRIKEGFYAENGLGDYSLRDNLNDFVVLADILGEPEFTVILDQITHDHSQITAIKS